MTDELKKYEKSIKKSHRFGWIPKDETSFRTTLPKAVFIPIVIKIFEQLEWDLVFRDEVTAEAKRKNRWKEWTEKITVTYDYGKVTVKSVSTKYNIWDNGQNSKRISLFLYALMQMENEMDKNALSALEVEVEKAKNWDNYEIPERLPQPLPRTKPNVFIPIISSVITALLLGFLLSFISVDGKYLFILFEFCVGFSLAFVFKYTLKFIDYQYFEKLNHALIANIILTYASMQFFLYLLVLKSLNYPDDIGFLRFWGLRIEQGLTINGFYLGSLGLIISWIIQVGLAYLFAIVYIWRYVNDYLFNRIPVEVVDFVYYHLVKEKNANEIRLELSKMGWTNKQDQDEVFEVISSVSEIREIARN